MKKITKKDKWGQTLIEVTCPICGEIRWVREYHIIYRESFGGI